MGSLRDRLAAELTNAITAGLDQYVEALANEIRDKAPSSGRAGNFTKIGEGHFEVKEMTELRTHSRLGARSDISYGSNGEIVRGRTMMSPGQRITLRYAAESKAAREKLKRGIARSKEGGTLKRGIHPVGAVVEGTRIVAKVRSEAPYSYYVEFGMGPGGMTPGRERNVGFFRKPVKQRQVDGAQALARYVRRID